MKVQSRISNERGSALVAMVMMLFTLGAAAFGTVELTSSERGSSVNEVEVNQALYIGQAGLEFAKYRVDHGLNPNASDRPFGSGEFDVAANAASRTITATGRVGSATKTQTIQTNFSSDCVRFDTTQARSNGNNNLDYVKLVKTCNTTAVLTRMKIDWNVDACVTGATYSAQNNLSNCPVDRDGNCVHSLNFNSAEIYNHTKGIGAPLVGITNPANEFIDHVDSSMSANGSYDFLSNFGTIVFSKKIKPHGLYNLVAEFSDGGQITTTFQDGTPVAPACTPGFVRSNGVVTVNPEHEVEVKVLGSSITYGAGGPEVNVNVQLGKKQANGSIQYTALFNGSDVDGGEVYTNISSPALGYAIKSKAWYSSFNRTYDSTNTAQVKTLINGETPPKLAGFGGQAPLQSFLSAYIDSNGKIKLNANQVIMLFELGTDMVATPNSSSADFQDLVVLLTIKSTTQVCH